jgi:hypothetical protein
MIDLRFTSGSSGVRRWGKNYRYLPLAAKPNYEETVWIFGQRIADWLWQR